MDNRFVSTGDKKTDRIVIMPDSGKLNNKMSIPAHKRHSVRR